MKLFVFEYKFYISCPTVVDTPALLGPQKKILSGSFFRTISRSTTTFCFSFSIADPPVVLDLFADVVVDVGAVSSSIISTSNKKKYIQKNFITSINLIDVKLPQHDQLPRSWWPVHWSVPENQSKKADRGRQITVNKYSTFKCGCFPVFASIPNKYHDIRQIQRII